MHPNIAVIFLVTVGLIWGMIILIGLAFTLATHADHRSESLRRRRRYIEVFDYATLLDAKLAEHRPELTPEQRAMVFGGLRDYFKVCATAPGTTLDMPSQAVDDAWHLFIVDTKAYEAFCARAFGRFLHHFPGPARKDSGPRNGRLIGSETLRHLRIMTGDAGATVGGLPILFAVDEAVGLKDGFYYDRNELVEAQEQIDRRTGSAGTTGSSCSSSLASNCGGATSTSHHPPTDGHGDGAGAHSCTGTSHSACNGGHSCGGGHGCGGGGGCGGGH